MDSAAAYQLLRHWAIAEKEPLRSFQHHASGDFTGKCANAGFQFWSRSQSLLVRCLIINDSESLRTRHADIKQELDRIARDEPERVFGAQFDLIRMPWETSTQPSLYLRRDCKTGVEGEIFEEWRKLRETAYLWHRTYYLQAINPVVKRRLQSR